MGYQHASDIMSQQAERVLKWGFQSVTAILLTVISWLGANAISQINDHEVRISTREANAFTSQDANKLLISINQLTFEVSQHRKELDTLNKERRQLAEYIEEIERRLSVSPKDVLAEIKSLRAELRSFNEK